MNGFQEVLSWRIFRDNPGGEHYMYFDARREVPGIRVLTEEEMSVRLDKLGSVSGSIRSDQLELVDACDGPDNEGPPSSFELYPEEV